MHAGSPRILDAGARDCERLAIGPAGLWVGSEFHDSSGAKFWATLLQEWGHAYPDCDRLLLQARCGTVLANRVLSPGYALANAVGELHGRDLRRLLEDALLELSVTGPPTPILVRLYQREELVVKRELSVDVADADLAPYLLGWLLRWAGVPASQWAGDVLRGSFRTGYDGSEPRQRVSFELSSQHLCEGLRLYEAEVFLHHDAEAAEAQRSGAHTGE